MLNLSCSQFFSRFMVSIGVSLLMVFAGCSETSTSENGSGGSTLPVDSGGQGGSDVTSGDAGQPLDSGTSAADVVSSDLGVFEDAGGSVDAGTPDVGSGDVGTLDVGTSDAGAPDAGSPDAGSPDAGAPDAGSPDAGVLDGGVADVGVSDAGASDAGVADAGVADAGAADAGAPDAGGPSYGPFTLFSCKKMVNKNSDGTVNPFISPARNNQFYVSWVQKGGNLMMTWEAPSSCKTIQGPLQVNNKAGDVYYWGGIGVVSDAMGNFYAVWESQTKGAEISMAWSTSGKTFTPPMEVVTTSSNGQDPALWVAKAGQVHVAWSGHHPTKKQYDPYFATSTDLFSTKKFTKAVAVHEDAGQDDQVAIASDSKGNLYYGWQSFDGDIFASKSTDGGKKWSAPVQVNDVKGQANVGKATFLVVTADDRVVLMWSDKRKKKSGNENDVFADSSVDGLTWGKDVQVNDNDARYQEDPSMAVGTGLKCKGAVYAVWQDFRNKKSYDVYMSRSTDGGLTWSKNEAVAKDLQGDEMNPTIAVDSGCVIGVAWRDSTIHSSFDIGLAFLTW